MKILLIITSWPQGGPWIQTQQLQSPAECAIAAEAVVQSIRAQAISNLAGPHSDMLVAFDKKALEWSVTTGGVGREATRVRCVELQPGAR